MALEIYDTFTGSKEQSVAPAVTGGLNPEATTKFAEDNALRVAGDLINIRWFGRVDFVKEGKVYLNLGQNAGLKVGEHLKVVVPGQRGGEPTTCRILDRPRICPRGRLKVTGLLGISGAEATGGERRPLQAQRSDKGEVRTGFPLFSVFW